MKSKHISAWVEQKVKKRIVSKAAKSTRSISYVVNVLLKKALNLK